MTEKEQAANMIDIYRKAKAKLQALGVVVEDLRIE